MKKIGLLLLPVLFVLSGCAELQQVAGQLPQGGVISNADIAAALREALDKGIDTQVTKLTQTDGFYKNELVKILLPDELKKVDKTLRNVGLGSLADEGIKMMNRAAENAVKEAAPIFVTAVKNITFNDARNILLGNDEAATGYLRSATSSQLYAKFNPVIKSSFSKVGADKVWANIITKYNQVPLVQKVNPDLTDYVTNEALDGVYKMIAVEEKNIRNNINARTSALLKKVFAMQDNR